MTMDEFNKQREDARDHLAEELNRVTGGVFPHEVAVTLADLILNLSAAYAVGDGRFRDYQAVQLVLSDVKHARDMSAVLADTIVLAVIGEGK